MVVDLCMVDSAVTPASATFDATAAATRPVPCVRRAAVSPKCIWLLLLFTVMPTPAVEPDDDDEDDGECLDVLGADEGAECLRLGSPADR